MDEFSVLRFIDAQARNYEQALSELKNGRKETHWMWYVFPQLRFLGRSQTAYYYGIKDEQEGIEYCNNKILYDRYVECCKALDSLEQTNPVAIMGAVDALKLRSSLTLFYMVDHKNKQLFKKLIDKFYMGEMDENTIKYIEQERKVYMKLNDEPFEQISNGKKSIEVRLLDQKRKKIHVGNNIIFTSVNNPDRQIACKVIGLHKFATFFELFERVGVDACGFQGCDIDQAVQIMRKYYSSQEEKTYGVVGIEIQLTD